MLAKRLRATRDRGSDVADRLTDLTGIVAALPAIAYGVYLILIGPAEVVETGSGVSLSISIPTAAGLLPIGVGLLALAGVAVRRAAVVGLAAAMAFFVGSSSLSTVGLPMLPVAAVLVIVAAGKVVEPQARRTALGVAFGGVAVGIALVLGLTVPIHHEYPFSYSIVDATTLQVVVVTGDPVPCAVEQVDESQTQIRIHAECVYPLLSTGSLAVEIHNQYVVHLAAPVGDRRVLDGTGAPGTLE